MPGLINVDVGSLAKSISDPIKAAIEKDGNLANINKEVEKQIQDFLSKINDGQIELNKIEAQSESLFKSGWRPALAWMAVAGFAWGFLIYPIVVFCMKLLGINQELPLINSEGLFQLVLALLGMSGIREFGKLKGTNTK